MNSVARHALPLFAALAALGVATTSFAQSAQKIVSANMQRIFADTQERKDLEAKFKARGTEAQAAGQAAQQRVNDLLAKRNQFRPGSSDYDKANQELTRANVEGQVAQTVSQAELIRDQKRSIRSMVDKIVATVKALAEEKGYSIVLMQTVPPELAEEQYDRMTPEQVSQIIGSRNVLFVANDVDVTAEVVARLDAAYKSGK